MPLKIVDLPAPIDIAQLQNHAYNHIHKKPQLQNIVLDLILHWEMAHKNFANRALLDLEGALLGLQEVTLWGLKRGTFA